MCKCFSQNRMELGQKKNDCQSAITSYHRQHSAHNKRNKVVCLAHIFWQILCFIVSDSIVSDDIYYG